MVDGLWLSILRNFEKENNSYYVSCPSKKGTVYANIDLKKELNKFGDYKKIGQSVKRGSKLKLENIEYKSEDEFKIKIHFRYVPLKENDYDKNITTISNILKNGGVVAIPTETVYGLAARADSDIAIKKIFAKLLWGKAFNNITKKKTLKHWTRFQL